MSSNQKPPVKRVTTGATTAARTVTKKLTTTTTAARKTTTATATATAKPTVATKPKSTSSAAADFDIFANFPITPAISAAAAKPKAPATTTSSTRVAATTATKPRVTTTSSTPTVKLIEVDPNVGPVDTVEKVAVHGVGIDSGVMKIKFGSSPAVFLENNGDKFICRVPAGAAASKVLVTLVSITNESTILNKNDRVHYTYSNSTFVPRSLLNSINSVFTVLANLSQEEKDQFSILFHHQQQQKQSTTARKQLLLAKEVVTELQTLGKSNSRKAPSSGSILRSVQRASPSSQRTTEEIDLFGVVDKQLEQTKKKSQAAAALADFLPDVAEDFSRVAASSSSTSLNQSGPKRTPTTLTPVSSFGGDVDLFASPSASAEPTVLKPVSLPTSTASTITVQEEDEDEEEDIIISTSAQEVARSPSAKHLTRIRKAEVAPPSPHVHFRQSPQVVTIERTPPSTFEDDDDEIEEAKEESSEEEPLPAHIPADEIELHHRHPRRLSSSNLEDDARSPSSAHHVSFDNMEPLVIEIAKDQKIDDEEEDIHESGSQPHVHFTPDVEEVEEKVHSSSNTSLDEEHPHVHFGRESVVIPIDHSETDRLYKEGDDEEILVLKSNSGHTSADEDSAEEDDDEEDVPLPAHVPADEVELRHAHHHDDDDDGDNNESSTATNAHEDVLTELPRAVPDPNTQEEESPFETSYTTTTTVEQQEEEHVHFDAAPEVIHIDHSDTDALFDEDHHADTSSTVPDDVPADELALKHQAGEDDYEQEEEEEKEEHVHFDTTPEVIHIDHSDTDAQFEENEPAAIHSDNTPADEITLKHQADEDDNEVEEEEEKEEHVHFDTTPEVIHIDHTDTDTQFENEESDTEYSHASTIGDDSIPADEIALKHHDDDETEHKHEEEEEAEEATNAHTHDDDILIELPRAVPDPNTQEEESPFKEESVYEEEKEAAEEAAEEEEEEREEDHVHFDTTPEVIHIDHSDTDAQFDNEESEQTRNSISGKDEIDLLHSASVTTSTTTTTSEKVNVVFEGLEDEDEDREYPKLSDNLHEFMEDTQSTDGVFGSEDAHSLRSHEEIRSYHATSVLSTGAAGDKDTWNADFSDVRVALNEIEQKQEFIDQVEDVLVDKQHELEEELSQVKEQQELVNKVQEDLEQLREHEIEREAELQQAAVEAIVEDAHIHSELVEIEEEIAEIKQDEQLVEQLEQLVEEQQEQQLETQELLQEIDHVEELERELIQEELEKVENELEEIQEEENVVNEFIVDVVDQLENEKMIEQREQEADFVEELAESVIENELHVVEDELIVLSHDEEVIQEEINELTLAHDDLLDEQVHNDEFDTLTTVETSFIENELHQVEKELEIIQHDEQLVQTLQEEIMDEIHRENEVVEEVENVENLTDAEQSLIQSELTQLNEELHEIESQETLLSEFVEDIEQQQLHIVEQQTNTDIEDFHAENEENQLSNELEIVENEEKEIAQQEDELLAFQDEIEHEKEREFDTIVEETLRDHVLELETEKLQHEIDEVAHFVEEIEQEEEQQLEVVEEIEEKLEEVQEAVIESTLSEVLHDVEEIEQALEHPDDIAAEDALLTSVVTDSIVEAEHVLETLADHNDVLPDAQAAIHHLVDPFSNLTKETPVQIGAHADNQVIRTTLFTLLSEKEESSSGSNELDDKFVPLKDKISSPEDHFVRQERKQKEFEGRFLSDTKKQLDFFASESDPLSEPQIVASSPGKKLSSKELKQLQVQKKREEQALERQRNAQLAKEEKARQEQRLQEEFEQEQEQERQRQQQQQQQEEEQELRQKDEAVTKAVAPAATKKPVPVSFDDDIFGASPAAKKPVFDDDIFGTSSPVSKKPSANDGDDIFGVSPAKKTAAKPAVNVDDLFSIPPAAKKASAAAGFDFSIPAKDSSTPKKPISSGFEDDIFSASPSSKGAASTPKKPVFDDIFEM